MTDLPDTADPFMMACIDMVGRTGATSWQVRYCDEEQPVVWVAVAGYPDGKHETAAAMNPARACMRLLEVLIDGGVCQHCKKPTGITQDITEQLGAQLVCWYQYDPELKTFRRGCE